MNSKELALIQEEGEGYKIEFKESLNSDVSREFVAMANSSGGRIFLGIMEMTPDTTLETPDTTLETPDTTPETTLEKIVNIIKSNPEITRNELAKGMGLHQMALSIISTCFEKQEK